jgi:hypothetical protein
MRSLKQLSQPGLPIWTVIVVLYLQFAFYNAFTVFETIGTPSFTPHPPLSQAHSFPCVAPHMPGTPYTQHAYGWSVTTNGFLFAGIGGGCIVSLVILQVGAMLFQDRTLLLVCEVFMACGFGLLIQYPFDEYVRSAPSFRCVVYKAAQLTMTVVLVTRSSCLDSSSAWAVPAWASPRRARW